MAHTDESILNTDAHADVYMKVSESVTIAPLPNCHSEYDISLVDVVAMTRYQEGVKFDPVLTPVHYMDSVTCYINSSKKRYLSRTFYEPKNKPRKFSDTLVIFPKRPQKTFVTFVDYHIDECRRWFKTSLEFKALTYTTKKILPRKGTDENENVSLGEDPDAGPGASQVFLPRFNKDLPGNQVPVQVLVNGVSSIPNGY